MNLLTDKEVMQTPDIKPWPYWQPWRTTTTVLNPDSAEVKMAKKKEENKTVMCIIYSTVQDTVLYCRFVFILQ